MKNEPKMTEELKIQLVSFIFRDAPALFEQLTPEGWQNSEYVRFFHPTTKQQLEEHVRITENINSLTRKDPVEKTTKETDFEQDDLNDISEIRAYKEFLHVLGLSVYDIFSMNHEVLRADAAVYDIGSFRESGSFMASFFHNHIKETKEEYNYMNFYMGSVWIKTRADLFPFYTFIFEKLKQKKCTWKYSYPQLYLIDLPQKTEDTSATPQDYNPGDALTKDLEAKKKQKEIQELREQLEDDHDKAYENSKYQALEKTVQAYKNIFRSLPEGHPQKEFED